eukprot:TRINITY_DN28821_c0_g1_i1.p1 TRINITY_DN28821_c0_g1~~TRINITY_DN28821_c0_g1_i1.p1  ORF type:complete len:556 (-),score=94.44 TRINITY_DN28821_c0_g1_i1:86-1753(-)
MGASGSGKTSLLTALRGLTSKEAVVTGEAYFNGEIADLERMRSLSSVVPQEDVFLAALTVRETLGFAAELRLPPNWSLEARTKRVDEVLRLLKLEKCAETAIGDEKLGQRGISGGERRRLSVGMAIIGGLPQVLLCDEPTSGLDSAAATNMVEILKSLTGRGVTVLCAIHQPSYSIFREFDQLLILEDGYAAFFGKVDEAEAYFAKHKSPTPSHVNPAHHYIQQVQDRSQAWVSRWQAASTKPQEALTKSPKDGHSLKIVKKGKSKLSFWRQTEILTRRTLLENFKNKKKFFRGVMSRLPASCLTGIFFWQIGAVPSQPSVFPVKGVIFLSVQNPMIETFYAGATTFQATKGLLKREYYDGLYQVAPYYLAYYIGFMAMQIPWTLAWAAPLYLLVGLPLELGRFSIYLLTTFLVLLMSCAAGSAVGAMTKDADGNRAVLMPLLIPSVLFSGYVIPLNQIARIWMPLYYLSPMQWGMSLLESNNYKGVVFPDCDASVPFELRRCWATGEEMLSHTTSEVAQHLGISGMLIVFIGYIMLALLLNIRMISKTVLDGRI